MRNEDEAHKLFFLLQNKVEYLTLRIMVVKGSSYYEQYSLLSTWLVEIVWGLRPYQTSNHLLLQWLVSVIYVLPLILHQFYQFITTDIKLQSNLNLLHRLFNGLCILCIYNIVYFHFATVRKLIACYKYDNEYIFKEYGLHILKKQNKLNKLFTAILIGFVSLYGISITTPSILSVYRNIVGSLDNTNLILPFPVINISNKGLLYYYCLLFYQITAIFTLLTIGCVIYIMYLYLIQHACNQLIILIFKIRQTLNNQKYKKRIRFKTNRDEFESIIQIIKSYTRITEYVDLINYFSKIIFLIGTIFSMMFLFFDLLYILQLSDILKNTSKAFECLVVIIGSVLTVYINFYIGQVIIDHSKAALEELCQVPFYNFSIKTQKLLLFMITRGVKPIELSIGGMFIASHETLAGVIQKAFSFAMVYYNML